MQHAGRFEEQIVARHRVVDARPRENQPVVAAERRNHDRGRHHVEAGAAEHRLQRRRPDAVLGRVSDGVGGEDVQVSDVGQDVQHGDGQRARGHRERDVALWILHFRSRESHVIPRVHRKQRPHHRGAHHRQNGQGEAARGPERRAEIRGERGCVAADREPEQDQCG